MQKLYIAYGNDMDVEWMTKKFLGIKLVGMGELHDYMLTFKSSAIHKNTDRGIYASLENRKGSITPALIWELSDLSEQILDTYMVDFSYYHKTTMPVTVLSKEYVGLVYNINRLDYYGLPSEKYGSKIEKAYERFHFDKKILNEAYKHASAMAYAN